ncbi:mandelate racemase/muconate lactonizing enzyme family protein [Planctomonas psychrotolerans]|uniref:mandelate racemase/muconate lactonizing enzyme family protein n=1 Tax=Planctomonas psychrotolerans TaxID=2528712 RepID=UPI001239C3AF|nr:mandelate racemase/muconate lactonizing enzyme family protein [Planctomonas psychrotolerans]
MTLPTDQLHGAADTRTDATVVGVTTTPLTASMPRPWVPDAPWLHVIRVEVECSDGTVGSGLSWTPTIGAAAVRALIDTDITTFVRGRSADPQHLWPELWRHLHEAGGGGVTTIAMAGIDTALWDAAGIRRTASLVDLIGRRRDSVPVYGSGVNLHYPLDELVAQAERWVAAGYDAVKMKVGKPDIAEDVDRVAAVRDVIGRDRRLRIDANQRWDLPTAQAAIDRLSEFDLDWIEEPLRADDTAGYRHLHGSCTVPIALGENLHTVHRFRDLLDAPGVDIVQPNVVRVGGITPFLEIADLAAERDVPLAPHLLPELSGQLAMVLAAETEVEAVEEADLTALGLLAGPAPVRVDSGRLTTTGAPGCGIRLVGSPAGRS